MKPLACGLVTAAGVLAGCDSTARAPIPPIDAAVPAVVETATFALG